jgi:PRTRC genetic system protein A
MNFPFQHGFKLRNEVTEIGTFTGRENVATLEVSDVDFKMRLPKIPVFLLETIVKEFKKDLSKENILLIYWSVKEHSYYLARPKAICDKISVVYEMTHTNDVLVMTVHSHNTMHAEFSETDNNDEIYTGLFGVIGDLDKQCISMSFRAGLEGSFKKLAPSDIFSTGGDVA